MKERTYENTTTGMKVLYVIATMIFTAIMILSIGKRASVIVTVAVVLGTYKLVKTYGNRLTGKANLITGMAFVGLTAAFVAAFSPLWLINTYAWLAMAVSYVCGAIAADLVKSIRRKTAA